MSAPELLARARQAGVALTAESGAIRVRASAPPPDGLLAELRRHKAALVALLTVAPGESRPAGSDRADRPRPESLPAEPPIAGPDEADGWPDDRLPEPPPLPPPGSPARAAPDARHAAAVTGLRAAAARQAGAP